MSKSIKLSLQIHQKTNDLIEKMCEDNNLSKIDFLKKSIALMQIALEYKKIGNHLIAVNERGEKQGEITGL